jgi:delta14-sterol reductase
VLGSSAPPSHAGIRLYDFFIGRELNPQLPVPFLGTFDLKYFCELRPGLFLWLVINAAMLLRYGGLTAQWSYKRCPHANHICRQLEAGQWDYAMWVVCALQGLYVIDSVYCEDCIITTMDIIQDGFGFMLVFGDLSWVPFMYSLQARYLATHALNASMYFIGPVLALGLLGFFIFRSANAQKDTFKKNPDHPSVARTCLARTYILSNHHNLQAVCMQNCDTSRRILAAACLPTGGGELPGTSIILVTGY